jgi:RHS repeat-associated protein
VEAYQAAETATNDSVQWLVADHLGTPRIVADQTGSLAGIRRHDYLPFGEEVGAGVGGRTQQQGYGQADGVRQKFTSKERDTETGLDYFLARYYSSTQGRFTSPDHPFADQHESDPQSWNLYSYAGNSPLVYTDPFGLWKQVDCSSSGKSGKCWEAEKDDTYETLAKEAGWNAHTLSAFFQGQSITEGQVFDTSGVKGWVIQGLVDNSPSYDFAGAGGLRVAGRVGSRFTSKLWNWLRGGSKANSEAAKRTIQVVQREGNLVEMVGTSAKGEIRVLTEMTREGDALVLKGLHMEGPGAGSMGLRELREFARQLGKEQGVNRVIVQGAERTTGANPGRVPRSIEFKVN